MRVECVVTRVVDRGYDRLLCLRQVGGDVGLLRDPIEIPFDHLGTGDSFAVGDHLGLFGQGRHLVRHAAAVLHLQAKDRPRAGLRDQRQLVLGQQWAQTGSGVQAHQHLVGEVGVFRCLGSGRQCDGAQRQAQRAAPGAMDRAMQSDHGHLG